MLDCQLYGLKPGGHHLTNVLLHAAAAVLLFLALRRMTGALWPSAWVAAVFAIHPLRVESVAWVAERKDVLSGLFFMLTLWFYARYAERPASWGRYLLVVASFALGLMAKPMLVTLPFVLLLLDYWPLGRLDERQQGAVSRGRGQREDGEPRTQVAVYFVRAAGRRENPLVCPGGGFVRGHARRPARRHGPWSNWPFPGELGQCRGGLRRLPRENVLPGRFGRPLSCFPKARRRPGKWLQRSPCCWRFPRPSSWSGGSALTCSVGWLWYLGTLVPVIGLVQVGDQAMADRYTYLTQIGLYMAVAWGAAHVAGLGPIVVGRSRPSRRWWWRA